MADNSNYRIILQGSIDPKSIDTELKNIQNKYKLILNVQLNSQELNALQTRIGNIQKQVQSIGAVNPLQPMATTALDIENRVKQIRESVDRFAKVNVSASIDEGTGETLNRAVIQYTDALGRSVTETMTLKNETKLVGNEWQNVSSWQTTSIKYSENIGKLEKENAAAIAKQAAEFEKMALQADKFIEKSKSLNQAQPIVARGIDLAKQLKESIEADRATGQLSDRTRNLSKELSVVNERVRTSGKNLQSWTTELGIAIKRTIEWSMGIGLVYGALNQLRQGVDYVKDLNKEMTNIKILQTEGARSNEEITQLAENFNSLAQEMSTTTLEVARGSVEWLRQGKSIKDTQELLRATTMLSKLGNLDAAQSTEYLTSTLNGYQLEAKEAENVVSKLVAVDNEAATSAGELAAALQKTANFAKMSGVSIDELIGYVGTVSSVTRKSAETIGTSFQAMFSRLSNIKLGNLDEEGASINDVEKALAKVNIRLRDSDTSFRNMSDVIRDVSEKWSTLTDVERASVSQAIAGTRQRENFIVLMENFDQVTRLTEISTNSAGLALKRYAIYQESIEAASNRLTAAWENMWQKAISSDAVKQFYNLATAALDLIDKIGGLETVLKLAVAALILFNMELIKNQAVLFGQNISFLSLQIQTFIKALFSGTNVIKSFTTAFGPTALLFAEVTIAVVALTWALNLYNKQVTQTQQAGLEGTAKSWSDHFAKAAKATDTATDVLNRYREAVERVNEAHSKGGPIVQVLVDKQEILKQGLIETIDRLKVASNSWDEYNKSVKEAAEAAQYKIDEDGKLYKEAPDFSGGTPTVKKEYVEGVEALNEEQFALLNASKMSADSWVNTWKQAGSQVKDVYSSLITTLEQLGKTASATTDIAAKQFDHKLSFEDIQKLAEIYPEYLDALSIEQGRIELNTDKLREFNIEKAQASLKAAEHAREMAIEEGAGQAVIKSLDKQIELLKNYVQQTEQAIPVSREYIHTVQDLIDAAGEKMGGADEMPDSFKQIGIAIATINKQFENGEITAKDYFDSLNGQIKGVDFESMFEGNQEAAQTFFAGLVLDAGQSLSQISSMFDSGQMSITEYTDSLASLTGVFESIGGMVSTFGASLGMSTDQISNITGAISGMTASTAELNRYQEMNVAIQQMMMQMTSQNLQAGTEEYHKYAVEVANSAAEAGYVYTDLSGKVYTSAEEIVGYLEQSNSNFMTFAGQTGNMTGRIIEGIVHQAGGMLVELGKAINNFKGKITIQPSIQKWDAISAMIAGITGNFFNLPTIDLNIGTNVGDAVMQAGAALQGVKFNMDEGIYKIPNAFNQVSDAISGSADAGDRLTDSINDAGGASDKLKDSQNALKTLLDLVVAMLKKEAELEKEALKEKLDNYKKIIDKRKEYLDSLKEERDYQKELEDKQKNLANLEAELLELRLDDSEEAKRKRLELEEQIAEQRGEIEDTQFDHSIDTQKEALDQEYDNYKEDIDRRIKELDDYLDKNGELVQEAMALINTKSDELYNRLMNWNMTYGDGTRDTITKAWSEAYNVLDQFRNALGQIDFEYAYSQVQSLVEAAAAASQAISNAVQQAAAAQQAALDALTALQDLTGESSYYDHFTGGQETHDGGGIVGEGSTFDSGGVVPGGNGFEVDSSHLLSRLLKGELTATPEQANSFLTKTLPSLLGMNSQATSNVNNGGNVTVHAPITVQGSLDENTLPKLDSLLDKLADKLTKEIYKRGINRPASAFSI